MRRFTHIQALLFSFFSKELYADIVRNWRRFGFTYLLLLLALAWLPWAVELHVSLGRWVGELAPAVLREFPRIMIKDGVVETDPPGRHVLKAPETGEDFLIIDTSVDLPAIEELQGDVLYLTRSKLVILQSRRGQTRIQDLSNIQEFSMTPEDAHDWLGIAATWAAILLYPVFLGFSFMYRICQAFLYALIGIAFARIANVALDYPALTRLAAVAVTPAVIADTVIDLTGLQVPLWWLICFLIAMFYLFFAVTSVSAQKPETGNDGLTGPPGIA